MSRKHFIVLAMAIKAIEDVHARTAVARKTANVCAQFNELFNRERFLRACGVN